MSRSETVESSWEALIRKERQHYHAQARRPGQMVPYAALALLLPVLALHPVGRDILGLAPLQALAATLPVVLGISSANVAYHRFGVWSRTYQAFDLVETVIVEVVIATLIIYSGRVDSGLWFLYGIHVVNLTLDPRPPRAHVVVILGMPICVSVYFALFEGTLAHAVYASLALAMVLTTVSWARALRDRSLRLGFENERLLRRVADENLRTLRSSIAREIHDGLAADLSAIAWKAEASALQCTRGEGGTSHENEVRSSSFQQIAERARRAVAEARSLAWGLSEKTPTWAEVTRTIEARAEELCDGQVKLVFASSGDGDTHLPMGLGTDLLRMTQEIIRNALQHSGATRISVDLRLADACEVEIDDNGEGMPDGGGALGQGLGNLAARVNHRGGELRVDAVDPGTRILARMPLPVGSVV